MNQSCVRALARLTRAIALAAVVTGFGASAPAEDLFAHFGFTADSIVPQILSKLKN